MGSFRARCGESSQHYTQRSVPTLVSSRSDSVKSRIMNSDETPKSKLIIDEDWKSKVEAEKAAAQRAASEPVPHPTDSSPTNSLDSKSQSAEIEPRTPRSTQDSESDDDRRLPPASLESLITMLGTQAMVALGQIPDPTQNKPVVRLAFARHYIDTLGVIEEKTKGNLSTEEAKFLDHILNDLRLAYISAKKAK